MGKALGWVIVTIAPIVIIGFFLITLFGIKLAVCYVMGMPYHG